MTDFFLRGPGALELLSRFGVNTFSNFTPGKAKQYVAANTDGHFIGDAILFHLDDELFDVVGHPTVANWLQYNAETGGYDVTFGRTTTPPADRPGRRSSTATNSRDRQRDRWWRRSPVRRCRT
jgi:glycine cleavage system aminomethyltransferase T